MIDCNLCEGACSCYARIDFHFRGDLCDSDMGDQLLSDDLVSEEFTFDRWPLLSLNNKTQTTISTQQFAQEKYALKTNYTENKLQ